MITKVNEFFYNALKDIFNTSRIRVDEYSFGTKGKTGQITHTLDIDPECFHDPAAMGTPAERKVVGREQHGGTRIEQRDSGWRGKSSEVFRHAVTHNPEPDGVIGIDHPVEEHLRIRALVRPHHRPVAYRSLAEIARIPDDLVVGVYEVLLPGAAPEAVGNEGGRVVHIIAVGPILRRDDRHERMVHVLFDGSPEGAAAVKAIDIEYIARERREAGELEEVAYSFVIISAGTEGPAGQRHRMTRDRPVDRRAERARRPATLRRHDEQVRVLRRARLAENAATRKAVVLYSPQRH